MNRGYKDNEQETIKAITPDGWLRTGDLGYLDENGYLYIYDRLKDLIKYKGLQIAPAEIEALLISRSEILDAAVIGLPDPQVPGNEIPRAFVVRRLQGKQLTVEEIQHFVRTNLAAHKQLRGGVEFIDEIPRNPSGKILHRKLLETVPKPRQVRL